MTKRKIFIVGFMMAAVACAVPAGGPAKKLGENPMPNLDGAWKIVSIKGTTMGEEFVEPVEGADVERFVLVRGNNVILLGWPEHRMWRIQMDPTKRPKELDLLDMVEMYDNAKGTCALKCIYELEKDTLKLMFHFGVARIIYRPFLSPDAPRPSGFNGGGEWPSVTLTMKRITK